MFRRAIFAAIGSAVVAAGAWAAIDEPDYHLKGICITRPLVSGHSTTLHGRSMGMLGTPA
jgi:hypothetical protein